ncbi:UPF0481 protein At3g47200-like [Pistacia vera]|uniref:UPF0481 protein At3g47200-like n=1 Tax=Pistacia vera TaxID=55513 RepID=UPI001263039C|nr:UPF0481 protein At3g47200-like [Pistacia vera]
MNLEMSASIEDQNNIREWHIDIEEHIDIEDTLEWTNQGYCIFRVPQSIRKVNEEAYTPKLISIGPFHHGKEELAEMEKQKPRYMESFLKRITMIKMEEISAFVKNKEQCIRNCYAETFMVPRDEFVKMILDDAIFIVELFWRHHKGDTSDLLQNIPVVHNALKFDFQLLENQLPYFVLEKVYKLAFVGPGIADNPSFMDLSYKFFGGYLFKSLPRSPMEVKHFTDLRRSVLLIKEGCFSNSRSDSRVNSNVNIGSLPCAVKLRESGVKFIGIERKDLLDIRFRKRSFFNIHDQLQIPCLEVRDETECLFRNIMALEQCYYSFDTRICNYVDMIDCLINTERDVDLLVGKGIISNHLGDNASVANMFNKLCSQICLSNSCYYNLCEELKAHYNNRWNKTKAKLRSVYFSNVWRGTATIAAIIILLLTILQTICSIMQVI